MAEGSVTGKAGPPTASTSLWEGPASLPSSQRPPSQQQLQRSWKISTSLRARLPKSSAEGTKRDRSCPPQARLLRPWIQRPEFGVFQNAQPPQRGLPTQCRPPVGLPSPWARTGGPRRDGHPIPVTPKQDAGKRAKQSVMCVHCSSFSQVLSTCYVAGPACGHSASKTRPQPQANGLRVTVQLRNTQGRHRVSPEETL